MRHHPAHPDFSRGLLNSIVYDPGTMTIAALAATGVSTAMQVAGTLAAGNAQQQAANYQAAQLRQQAGQARASSQRDALNQQRTASYALSKAQSVAAASGGNTLDPTVANIEGNIAGEGEYNALTSLFNGEERARGMEQGAATDRYQGEQEQQASQVKAVGTLANTGSSLMMKYSNPFSSTGGSGAISGNVDSSLPWSNAGGYSGGQYNPKFNMY